MRTESSAYAAERKKMRTKPNAFVRFYDVPKAGGADETPFQRDFTAHPVVTPHRPKIACIPVPNGIRGNTQRVNPIAGTSEIGVLTVDLLDVDGEITRQVSDPALPLAAELPAPSMIPVLAHPIGLRIIANEALVGLPIAGDVSGYPETGHVTVEGSNGREDIFYSGRDTTNRQLLRIKRGQRGTTAVAHEAGTPVHNGEQIRRSVRASLFLGYGPLAEADYTEFIKLEVASVTSLPGGLGWSVTLVDLQRFAKKSIFELATSAEPFEIGPDHPLTIALKVLTSTGAGTNGPYDVLAAENGVGMPQALVDVAGLEALRTELPGLQMQFKEIAPQDAKRWIEGQIFRPLNIVPVITQHGQYSGRLFRQPEFRRSMIPVGMVIRLEPSAAPVFRDYRRTVLDDNPVAYWRLGDKPPTPQYFGMGLFYTDQAIAKDETGHGHDGTYQGNPTLGVPGLITGDPDTAVQFDGVDDSVLVGSHTDFDVLAADSLTLAAWVKTTSSASMVVLQRIGSGGITPYYRLEVTAGQPRFFVRGTISGEPGVAGPSILDGLRHHIVGVRDVQADLLRLYVDGVEVATVADSSVGDLATSRDVWIGSHDGGTQFFNGLIDDVAIYAHALSPDRIRAHYEAGIGAQS